MKVVYSLLILDLAGDVYFHHTVQERVIVNFLPLLY